MTTITAKARTTKEPLEWTIYCVLLFMLALWPRLLYDHAVLDQFANLAPKDQPDMKDLRRDIAQIGEERSVGYFTPDSADYVELAAKLLKGSFADAVSSKRPIGYPFLLALTGLHPTAILTVQAVLLSIIPICTFFLVSIVTRCRLLGFASGLISCISPTGIALGAFLLADAFFSVLFAVSFVALIHGALFNSGRWIVFSAMLSGIAVLVKPILLFWPFISLVIYLLIAGLQELMARGSHDKLKTWLRAFIKIWRPALLLVLIPLLVMTSWAGLNYWHNGVFTVSSIGALALRLYLAPEVEQWEATGTYPASEAVHEKQVELRRRFSAIPTEKEKLRIYSDEAIAIFKHYPSRTAQALIENALTNSTEGWGYFPVQIPDSQNRHSRILSTISWREHQMRKLALLPVVVAPIVALSIMKWKPSPQNLRLAVTLCAMTLTFLYFFLVSGTTFWTGPRVLYPSEILTISTSATLLALLARVFVRRNGSYDGSHFHL